MLSITKGGNIIEVFGVVYLIRNTVNGKRYVGQTIQTLEEQFNQHLRSDSFIGKAIRKYGRENFRYGIIKTCATEEELDECELGRLKFTAKETAKLEEIFGKPAEYLLARDE